MQNPEEMWQAEVGGEVYDASFGELTVWITESSLLENDKVRRGRLRWLEAGRVPQLRDFFNAKANGTEPPYVHVSVTNSTQPIQHPQNDIQVCDTTENLSNSQFVGNTNNNFPPQNFANAPQTDQFEQTQTNVEFCEMHPEIEAEFICDACSHYFCNECPQGFGTSVKVCPYCGAMCKELHVFQESFEKDLEYQNDIAAGFTFGDFGKALAYPFKFKTSLFFGGLFMAFFSIGQGAAGMGSLFLIAAAIICYMFANALSFGVLANTVENFSKGIKDKNFMPNFDDFNMWDDVVHPFFLSIAVWISSFGLLFLLIAGMVWFAMSSIQSDLAKTTNLPMATVPESIQTKKHIEGLLDKYKKQNEGRLNLEIGEDGLTEGQRSNLDEEAQFQELSDLATNYRKTQLEGTFGKTPETKQKEQQAMVSKLFAYAGGFIILAGIALLWGLFYFPAACAVAGYTRSFKATLNPLVGLDTIKHLGVDYIKILFMSILIGIMSAIIGGVLAMIFSPFNLPTFGNLPATFIGSFATFYFSAVYAVMLGYALYKNSDKLQLSRG